MGVEWTVSQKQRLKELGISSGEGGGFPTVEEREAEFSRIAAQGQARGRKSVREMLEAPQRHPLAQLEEALSQALVGAGFTEVRTPTIISAVSLERMGIGPGHPLREQVFWIDEKRCLRPMLAPNLYFLMRHLKRSAQGPLRLFEVGPCFRRESRGSSHLEEFTMLNLVELAPVGDPTEQLHRHIATIMTAAGLPYELRTCESEVYVHTTDVEVDGVEVASGAVGPHKLDAAHGITGPWAGVGFGLERLQLMKGGADNIKKVGRSLIYLRGTRLDI